MAAHRAFKNAPNTRSLLVSGLRLPLAACADKQAAEAAALQAALKKTGLRATAIEHAGLHKVSVDARRGAPVLVYSLVLALSGPQHAAALGRHSKDIRAFDPPARPWWTDADALPATRNALHGPVVVCGLGPAGLFAALELAEAGYTPLVLERGPAMDERRAAVAAFEAGGPLGAEANIQFGEGGAGTFSDGKLRTRIGDVLCRRVTERFLQAGAPPEIGWSARPHIGTDRLRDVLVALRGRLESLGGQVCFNTRLNGLVLKNGRLAALETSAGPLPCAALVLACGHSARDTFEMLDKARAGLQPKAFSVGFRAEHPQSLIDEGLYHAAAGHPALPPGEYQLSTKAGGIGVYTFCMCPGGTVVAAASEAGGVVTNGMSLQARSGSNANAAVVAGVDGAALGVRGAIDFQRRLEQAAYAAGGGGYTAPAQRLGAFLEGRASLDGPGPSPSYPRGVSPADLGALLPANLAEALRQGLRAFGRKLPGYAGAGALLTGLETRTSSPVRLPRGDDHQSTAIAGLWPCGEGAGYAGGIMSAAVDGIKTAAALIAAHKPPAQTG